ncbi:PHP domain-containing protein [Kangiella sp. HZ709]|uniref:PHP domain-containing protein n=1 Tax=Kangiella sp. HZ709 TaxID=2666328 RepID=UPI0012B0745B|nr:PHP domain-containing protein [Kangiella sp. HZ709]MRX28367.1 PHP domain-containing protein [Kangiella sp. HZ709]
MIDLHTHTYYSDGSLSPVELIDMAEQAGIKQLAISDHDSIDGLLSLELLPEKLRVIPSVEISTNYGKQGLHILGLNIDTNNQALQSFLKQQQKNRKQRALQIANKLVDAGVEHALDDVSFLVDSQPMVCRTHIAQLLLEQGYVKKFSDAFKKYLAKGGKAHIKDDWFAIEDVISIIKSAGGQAVIAHPMRYGMGANKLKSLIEDFKALGGDGIEICYPNIHPGHKNLLATWAKTFKLCGSQGSDFHNPDKSWVKLGKFAPLPDDVEPVWTRW